MTCHRRNAFHVFILLALIYGLSGCVPLATDVRKEAFRSFDKSFGSLGESPTLNEVIELGGVKVHIVGHRQFFNYHRAAAYGSPVIGYATSNNEIWVFGKVVRGRIVVNQAVLGHELMHLLNFKNRAIADPDRLDDLGA
ncbi:MAG: hypothetical protein C4576_34905 [Desulfobacteraceae bacterium]|nr:MAG: hypothetical protein C4576_34905 [Desulfobacteraceae bacterium]